MTVREGHCNELSPRVSIHPTMEGTIRPIIVTRRQAVLSVTYATLVVPDGACCDRGVMAGQGPTVDVNLGVHADLEWWRGFAPR